MMITSKTVLRVAVLLALLSLASPQIASLIGSVVGIVTGLLEEIQKLLIDWNDTNAHPSVAFSDAINSALKNFGRAQPSTTTTTTTTTTTSASTTSGPTTTPVTTTTKTYPIHYRTDIRLLTKDEWRQYHETVQQLCDTKPDPSKPESWCDVFAGIHRSANAPAAHGGPGFIAWHARFMQAWENLLKSKNPSLKSVLVDPRPDTEIPSHCDSCIYTADILGNSQGVVTNGPFQYRKVYPADCAQSQAGPLLNRSCSASSKSLLIGYDKYQDSINNRRTYMNFVRPYNASFEDTHGGLHVATGGHINILSCAANDPYFFMLHGFIHMMFDASADRYYTQDQQVQMQYPTSGNIPKYQKGDDPATPFDDVTLSQCLQESMEANRHYEVVPNGCSADADCNPTGSDMNGYWCKASSGRCASKIRIGGKCTEGLTIYPDKACFRQSFCADDPKCGSAGRCQCTDSSGNIIDKPPTP